MTTDSHISQHSSTSSSLGQLLRSAREAKWLSIRQLSEQADVPRSTLLQLEQDKVAKPSPKNLDRLASTLGIASADLYAAAGYSHSTALPSFTPYLRTKYAGLPLEAQAELEESFSHIAEKYGYDASGPAPGEDEI